MTPQVSAEPLKRLIRDRQGERSLREFGEAVGITDRHLSRILGAVTIGLWSADRTTIKLGAQPELLWPEAFIFWPTDEGIEVVA